jgi:hypothetical protein
VLLPRYHWERSLPPLHGVAFRMNSSPNRPRLPNPFRRPVAGGLLARAQLSFRSLSHSVPVSMLALPDDVLQLICFHTICQQPSQTWVTPADLGSPTAQSWLRVCRAFQTALYACVDRFSFFVVKNHVATQRAASTHAHLLRSTLPRFANLRELQLFIRPRDVFAVDAVATFLGKTAAPLRIIHLCCAPPPLGDSVRDPMPVVTDVIREIAAHGQRLKALSLDCCYAISTLAAQELADGVGLSLERLALDASLFQNWNVLTNFQNIVELRLQNTVICDSDLCDVLGHLPLLESLAVHQVASITGVGLEPLTRLQNLHTLELSRCIGIDNEAILSLAKIMSLTTVRLVHIDVAACALEKLVRDMGPRLVSLSVNAISAAHDVSPSSSTEGVLKTLLHTVKTHCKNVRIIDFGDSSILPGNHWSVRPYTEALRHSSPIMTSPSPVSGSTASHRSSGYRLRPRRRSQQRPISCFY